MRKRFSDIRNIKLFTADDMHPRSIGKVTDMLIEDESWDVRYLVVSIDAPLSREVLISPAAIHGFDFENQSMGTMLTNQQIAESPAVDSDQTISREYEQALVDYYGWPIYWFGRAFVKPQTLDSIAADDATEGVEETADSNLRSAKEICGYQIKSNNGPAGFMKDLVVHLESWKVDYATADTTSWLPSESSVFSTTWVSRLDWANRVVEVDLRKAALEPSPTEVPAIINESLVTQPFRTA